MMGNIREELVENKVRWVKVSTTVFEHHFFRDDQFCERSAWVWMIANAAWKKRRIRHHGKMLDLERGQLLGARQFLAEKWKWGEKKVRLFLDRLEAEKMIERGQSRGRNANIITICNYDTYQLAEKIQGQQEGRFGAGSGPVEGQTLRRYSKDINTTDDARARKVDAGELYDKLVEAANGSLHPLAAGSGLVAVSDPIGWIREGADVDLDILPAVRELGHKAVKGSVRSWRYFAPKVAENKARRERGLPVVHVEPGAPRKGSEDERFARLMRSV